jgi:predicted AlkP superfamily pyrophosphatase or phosphodiesterase
VVKPVQEFDDIYVDLVDFSLLLDGDNSPVEQEFNKILLDEYHGPDRPNAHGLSIVFFDRSNPLDVYLYDPSYRNFNPDTKTGSRLALINEFNWDEMTHTYFSLQYPDLPN